MNRFLIQSLITNLHPDFATAKKFPLVPAICILFLAASTAPFFFTNLLILPISVAISIYALVLIAADLEQTRWQRYLSSVYKSAKKPKEVSIELKTECLSGSLPALSHNLLNAAVTDKDGQTQTLFVWSTLTDKNPEEQLDDSNWHASYDPDNGLIMVLEKDNVRFWRYEDPTPRLYMAG